MVIHSLISGCEHIPYRDSKLTRLLQESLGGNYKTSLVVTCSTHSSSLEETLSTLKFASRAKTIKNVFKMNIKTSNETLQRIIEQLKKELIEAKLALTGREEEGGRREELGTREGGKEVERRREVGGRKERGQEKKREGGGVEEEGGRGEGERREEEEGGINKAHLDGAFVVRKQKEGIFELIQKNEVLQMRILSQDKEIVSLNNILVENENKLKHVEDEVYKLRSSSLNHDKKVLDLQEERDIYKTRYENMVASLDLFRKEAEIYKKQIESLKLSLVHNDSKIRENLNEKKKISKFDVFL